MSGSHTPASACHNDGDDRRLQLVSTAERGLPEQLAGAIDGHLATFAAHVREGLLAASTAVGLEVMAEMMQAEVTEIAGPKGRHNPERTHTRHGNEDGTVTLGGRRLPVTRPRVRTVGDEPEEATFASYVTFADTDLLSEQVTARMLAGISTRKYPVALEPVGETVERSATSTSKSAVSGRPRPRCRARCAVVIDGGKALSKAIRAAFGPKAAIQRCHRHKERNVVGHLPEAERPLIQRKLRAAWANPDADGAERELEALARALDKKRSGAAASLREGLEQTLTVNRLGITGSLLNTVESTNPVESMIEIVRHHARRVKHWQHGEMALRWTAAGMLAAEAQFRRVKGFRQLPQLLVALEAATADQPGVESLEQRVAG